MQHTPGDGAEPPAVTPPQPQHLQDWAPILDALTLPQLRYLAAVQGGATEEAARLRASGPNGHGVYPASVLGWHRSSSSFARAHDAIQAGMAVLGVPTSRDLAAADMPDLVGHWSRKAREAEKDRDQATFGRLLGDVSGAIPRGALVQVVAQTTVQVAPGPAPHQPGGLSPRYLEQEQTGEQGGEPEAPVSGTEPGPGRRDVTHPERTDAEERR